MATPNSNESGFGHLKDLWKTNRKKFLLLAMAAFLILIGLFVGAVEVTSSRFVCGLCHEMDPAFRSWEQSGHYKDSNGKIIADCRACHLPPWTEPVNLVGQKIYHSVKDGVKHFTDADRLHEASYHEGMKRKARHSISSGSCLVCHRDIYSTKFYDKESIHFLVRGVKGSRCIDCHKDLVHEPYPLPAERTP